MGNMQSIEMAEQVALNNIKLEAALDYHLTSNHYPPYPVWLIPYCVKAIELANEGQWQTRITLNNGKNVTVAQMIEGCHLEFFLTGDDD